MTAILSGWLKTSAGQITAYASVHWLPYFILDGPEGYLSELFVHEQARGKGIGTLLLASVKKEARRRGCSRLLLENNRTRNSYLRGFYLKDGWEERTRMASFVFDLTAHTTPPLLKDFCEGFSIFHSFFQSFLMIQTVLSTNSCRFSP